MHLRALPLISQPDLMPHGSGYMSILSVLLLPRRSDRLILRWWRECGIIVLDRVINIIAPTSPVVITMSVPRGSAFGLAHRISFGEQVAQGFHKNLCICWHGAGSS